METPMYRIGDQVVFSSGSGGRRVGLVGAVYHPIDSDEWKYAIDTAVYVKESDGYYVKKPSHYTVGESELTLLT